MTGVLTHRSLTIEYALVTGLLTNHQWSVQIKLPWIVYPKMHKKLFAEQGLKTNFIK